MLINVTQDHIDRGEPQSHVHCAIGLAIFEQTDLHCSLAEDTIMLWRKDFTCLPRNVKTPEVAARFMSAYDCGYHVAPFSFELEEPVWTAQVAA